MVVCGCDRLRVVCVCGWCGVCRFDVAWCVGGGVCVVVVGALNVVMCVSICLM